MKLKRVSYIQCKIFIRFYLWIYICSLVNNLFWMMKKHVEFLFHFCNLTHFLFFKLWIIACVYVRINLEYREYNVYINVFIYFFFFLLFFKEKFVWKYIRISENHWRNWSPDYGQQDYVTWSNTFFVHWGTLFVRYTNHVAWLWKKKKKNVNYLNDFIYITYRLFLWSKQQLKFFF